jgi:hypothetical protein
MQEWYLLMPDTRPNITGGYENESFIDYKDDAFYEMLQTDIASNVILYNSDLSSSSIIRCVIQGNTADTQLKSMERVGLFSCGTVKAGMYIFFEDRYWLITGYPGTNGIYEKATMVLCQYKLRWQNSSGDIIERWCNGTSASKYDMGENGNSTITLSSNTFALLLPDDELVLELDGKRVFIDKHKTTPTKVYKVTRSDDILYDYGDSHGGILSFIADKTELNPITDNQELRICDYHSPALSPEPPVPDETTDLSAVISGGNTLRCGRAKSWTVTFLDQNGNEIVDQNFQWKVDSERDIKQMVDGQRIQLKVDDEQLIDCSFLLSVMINNTIRAKVDITIIAGL